jgi:hypothetical protein
MSGVVPAQIAAHFTMAELAVLTVVAREVRKGGTCSLPLDPIAALAGAERGGHWLRTKANGFSSRIRVWTVGRHPRRSVAVGRHGTRQRSAARMAATVAGLSTPGVSTMARS